MMNITVEEENLLSMYKKEAPDRKSMLYKLQYASSICDNFDMYVTIVFLVGKLEKCTDEGYNQLMETVTFTDDVE